MASFPSPSVPQIEQDQNQNDSHSFTTAELQAALTTIALSTPRPRSASATPAVFSLFHQQQDAPSSFIHTTRPRYQSQQTQYYHHRPFRPRSKSCNYCGKIYTNKSLLRNHIQREHLQPRPRHLQFLDLEGGGINNLSYEASGGSGATANQRRYSAGPIYQPQSHQLQQYNNHQTMSLFNINGSSAHQQMMQTQSPHMQQQGNISYSSSSLSGISYYYGNGSNNGNGGTPSNSNCSTPMPFMVLGGSQNGQTSAYLNPTANQSSFVQLEEITWKDMAIHASAIRDVWDFNLREEFKMIRSLVKNGYNYISVDTEFPGAPVRPIGTFCNASEYLYAILRVNCDSLRMIQAGITLMDENGNLPPGICTWQFNFKFNLDDDMYAQESIDLLKGSGIQFHRLDSDGIDPPAFAEYLLTSGLILTDEVRWISFHSGYDFGYLFRVLMSQKIPEDEVEFFGYLKVFFPYLYDVKNLLKSCRGLKGGLQEVSEQLKLQRLGPSHQAGSDSLLTGMLFFKLKEDFFDNIIEDHKYNGRLYGLAFTLNYYGGENVQNSGETWTSDVDAVAAIENFTKNKQIILLQETDEKKVEEASTTVTPETENSDNHAVASNPNQPKNED